MPLERCWTAFDELAAGNDHFEFYWFPHTETHADQAQQPGAGRRPMRPVRAALRRLDRRRAAVQHGLRRVTRGRRARAPALPAPFNRPRRSALAAPDVRRRVVPGLRSPRRVRFREMEYAVPREAIVDVAAVESRPGSSGAAGGSPFPIEVRVRGRRRHLAVDGLPAARRRTSRCTSTTARTTSPTSGGRGVDRRRGGRAAALGQAAHQDAVTLARLYPRFDDFVEVRDRLDPSGVFANDYLDRVAGSAG